MKRLKETFDNAILPYKTYKTLSTKDKFVAVVFAILTLGSIIFFTVGVGTLLF